MIPIYKDPPLGTQNPSPAERLSVVFNGYTLNDPAGTAENGVELVDTGVTPITDQVIENKQGRDGMEAYQAFKSGLMIRMRGWIRKPTLAELMDEATLMAEKFDAALVSRRTARTTIGFLPMTFSVPTAKTGLYPTGLVPCFYSVRTLEPITFGRTKYDGHSMPFRIEMIARDPRRYFATLQTQTLNAASQVVSNPDATYPSWPSLVITMSGSGSAAFGIKSLGGGQSPTTMQLNLNLSTLVNGDVVRVDMENRRIYVNEVLRMDLFVSGQYWPVEVGGMTVEVFNGTNTTRRIDWYRAFAA